MLTITVKHPNEYSVSGNAELKLINSEIIDGVIGNTYYIGIGNFSKEFLQDLIALQNESLIEQIAEQLKQDIITFLKTEI